MTRDKFLTTCALYSAKLRDWGARPMAEVVNANAVQIHDLKAFALHHAAYMVEKMPTMYDENPEKAMRWLGFVQGVFYMTGYMTVDDMKDHNR